MMDHAQLEALLTIDRERSFAAAARKLGISASAISQRIKLLEARTGAVLIRRGRPVVLTDTGYALSRHAEAIEHLENDVLRTFADPSTVGDEERAKLRVVIDSDSLASWFMDVLAEEFEAADPRLFEISFLDQDHSIQAMRDGESHTAVSSDPEAVQGYKARSLGMHSYKATASPRFVKRHFPNGVLSGEFANAPCVRRSALDSLAEQWLEVAFDQPQTFLTHELPSSPCLVEACRNDVGWGMSPSQLVAPHLASGELVELLPSVILKKDLYWHVSLSAEKGLQTLTRRVMMAAHRHLEQKPGQGFSL